MVRTGQRLKDPEGKRTDWETPARIFKALDAIFNFKLDAAASKQNALCKKFFTREQNALRQEWYPGPVFINPPYGTRHEMLLWAQKIAGEAEREKLTIAAVMPNSSECEYHQLLTDASDYLLNVRRRVRFEINGVTRGTPFQGTTIFLLNTKRANVKALLALGKLLKPVR